MRAGTVAIFGALALACQPTASIGSSAGPASAATDAGSTSSPTTTGDPVGTSGPTSADASTAHDGEGSGDGGSSSSEDGGASSTTGEPIACFPAPFDAPCISCAKEACCAAFAECAADQFCGCTLGCLQYAGPFGCMCPPSALVGPLYECLFPSCDLACPP